MDQVLRAPPLSVAAELQLFSAVIDGTAESCFNPEADEWKHAGEELFGSPRLFRQITESIGEVFWMVDADSAEVVYASPAFERIWGRSCESLYADSSVGINSVHPEDRRHARFNFDELFRGDAIANEYRIVRPDGSIRFIRDRGFPVRDDAGKVIRIAGVAEDVTRYKESEAALARSEFRFQRLVESDLIGVFEGDASGRILEANEKFLELAGYTRQDLFGGLVRWDQMTAPGWEHVHSKVTRALKATGRSAPVETVYLRKDGGRIPVLMGLASLEPEAATAIGFIVDISRRKAAEEELRRSEENFRQFGENVRQVFWLLDLGTSEVLYVNPAYEEIWQRSRESVYRDPNEWKDAIHPEDRESAEVLARRQLRGELLENEYRIVQPSGAIRWIRACAFPIRDTSGRMIRQGGVAEDITDRKHYEISLRHQALHDQLTDLPNRRMLSAELEKAIARQKARGGFLAVFFLDLDRFKLVNDSMGHAAGDQLLRGVSERLLGVAREGDILARIGGDQFAVVAPGLATREEAGSFGEKLRDSLRLPFLIAGRELFMGAALGVGIFPGDGDDPDMLQRSADSAVQEAKRCGNGHLMFFSEKFAEEASERLAMETRMRRGLALEEFRLEYQAQFSHGGTQLMRFEALIRWHPPESKPVTPDRFIPVAEENGLIVPIGAWALAEACRAAAAWQSRGQAGIGVAVNVSARQFGDADFVGFVETVLSASGLPASLLELEITESVFIADLSDSARKLAQLKNLGVTVALDDFGTGYSSLSYLRHLPIDVIKIDRSFLAETGQKESGEAVLRCVVELAHALEIRVIVEGVETPAQRDLLRRLGCDGMQGFLLGRPGADVASV